MQNVECFRAVLTCALPSIAGFVILALNGIAARLELQHAADPARPQNDFANMKKGKSRERIRKGNYH